jgi:predicted RNase H-like nuclease
VFPTPPLELLMCASPAEANELAKERDWPGISAQAFGLKKQILAIKEVATDDERVWEVHPEVSFAEANGQLPLEWAKTNWNGAALRRYLLEFHGVSVPGNLGDAGVAGVPDVIDAAIAAWSAHRIATGLAESLPAGAGRIGAIWR